MATDEPLTNTDPTKSANVPIWQSVPVAPASPELQRGEPAAAPAESAPLPPPPEAPQPEAPLAPTGFSETPAAPPPDPISPDSHAGEPTSPSEPTQINPPQESETFVVPTDGGQVQEHVATGAENPFVPQGVASDGGHPPKKPGLFTPKRLIMLVIFMVFVLLIVFAAKFFLGVTGKPKQVTLTYWGLWEADSAVQSVIADFEAKNPSVKITYLKQSPRQYRERLDAAINREEGPDIFRFHNTWVPMLIRNLSTVPKTVMTPAEFAQTFYPVASADLVGGANIYGMPLMIDGLGLYINTDLLKAANVTPPTTWEDMLRIVPMLTVRSDTTITTSAIALGTATNVENFSDIVATMMIQNGVNLREPTGKEAEEALLFYRKFSDPSDPVYTWNESLDNSVYAFASGKVAMIIAPSWRAFDIAQINPNLKFTIAPIPQLPGTNVTWASYWVEGVSAKSKFQPQAWEFVKYLTSKEAATKLYSAASKTRLFGEPYARTDLGSSLNADPYVGAYIKQAPNAKSFPLASRTSDNGLNDQMIKYLEDAINGLNRGSAPSAVLQTVSAGFNQVLGKYGLVSAAAPPAK